MTGVSYATVSRALSGKAGVNEETRKTILAEAANVGYQPNAVARGLVTRKTNIIGLAIPDITNPFFPEIARGVEDAASELGYNIFLCNTNWSFEKEETYLRVLQERRVDGIIITPVSDEELYRNIQIPMVFISRVPAEVNSSFVVIDNVRGGFLATKHLLETGYKRIAFIGGKSEVHVSAERLEGYKAALNRYKHSIDETLIVSGKFNSQSGYELAGKLLSGPNPPDAVFAANDVIALGVLQSAKELGLNVPGEFGIVGFDDIPFAAYSQIQLTTVSQPKYQMGKIAAEICIGEIGDRAKSDIAHSASKKIILEPELVVRGTTR